jgi:hypothetical protein
MYGPLMYGDGVGGDVRRRPDRADDLVAGYSPRARSTGRRSTAASTSCCGSAGRFRPTRFAGRIIADDLTGITDRAGNEKGSPTRTAGYC